MRGGLIGFRIKIIFGGRNVHVWEQGGSPSLLTSVYLFFCIDETTNNITITFNTGVSISTKSIGLLAILQECSEKLSASELEVDDTTTLAHKYEPGIDIQEGVFIKEES